MTAVAASAQLGGTERVLLDFAARAFEHDVALRVLVPKSGPLVDILNELGVPTQVVPASARLLRGSQRPGALISLPFAIAGLKAWGRALLAHPFVRDTDVLYSVAFKAHVATAPWDGPIVWHLHEFPPALTGLFWKQLARRTPAALIANSQAVGVAWGGRHDGMTERRNGGRTEGMSISPSFRPSVLPSLRLSVIPNGVDLDRFRPRERTFWMHDRLGIPHDDRLIGMPAVLARWKGQLEVLDAFAQAGDQLPEAHLVFVGGSIYDTAAERAYERVLRTAIGQRRRDGVDRVHLVPFQAKIELVYPELDLAVHYSTRPEAFGRVVLEAMACAVPIIAAAEGGPREVVTEGGWLVEPRNPEALAAAMVGALGMAPDSLRQLGAQGRVRAEDHYSARRFAREVAEVMWEVKSVKREERET